MQFSEFRNLIEKYYPQVLEESGEVFFGSRNSLTNSNGIAIIGLNPGGSGLPEISKNIERYGNDKSTLDFSGYLDQCWHEPYFSSGEKCPKCLSSLEKEGIVHQDRHQKMISKIAKSVGFDLRRTIAMNAIWIQTRSAAELRSYLAKSGNKNMLDLFKMKFFPIFKEIFAKCNIKLVLCLGNGESESSFEFFRNTLGIDRKYVVRITENYRDGRYFEAIVDGKRILLFGIAHPSMHITSDIGIEELKKKWAEIA